MEEFGSRYHFKCAPANIANSKPKIVFSKAPSNQFLSDCFVTIPKIAHHSV